jgi:hypothetical protein
MIFTKEKKLHPDPLRFKRYINGIEPSLSHLEARSLNHRSASILLPLLTLTVILIAVHLMVDGAEGAVINVDTDWIVDTTEDLRSDDTYVMKANLTVTGTGQISFRRCEFTFMSEEPGEYGIIIQPGGYLLIHTCTLKAGFLSPSVMAEAWTFHVMDSGRLSLQTSEVYDLGVVGGVERERGLALESDNVLVTSTTFEECNRGIVVMGGASPQIIENIFKDNLAGVEVKGSSFDLRDDNTFEGNQIGILFQEVNDGFLGAGSFMDNNDAVRAVQSNVMVENITLAGMGDGFLSELNSNMVVENCTVGVLFDKGTANFNSNLKFINCDVQGWTGFTKTDSTSHIIAMVDLRFRVTYTGVDYPVEGADVELRDKDGNKVYQQVTGDDGFSAQRAVTVLEHHNGQQSLDHQPFTAVASLGFNYAEVKDMVLTPNYLVEMSFTDDDPPDLTVQLPVDGASFDSEEVEVRGRLKDLHSGISTFHYTVNGGENHSLPIQDPWQAMVVLPEGQLTLEFVAVDLLGNVAVVTRNVNVDTTPPEPWDLDPPQGTVTRKYQFLLNGTTDAGTVLRSQGEEWEVSPNGTFSHWVTLGDSEGEQTIKLRLTDLAGNENIFDYVVIVDRTPPSLTVDTDPDYRDFPYVNTSQVRVFGESEPNATVTVLINSQPVGEAVVNETGMWSIDVELVLGENDLLVDAWDPAGNRASVEIIDFWYDVMPPEITLLDPKDGAVFKNKVTAIYVRVRTEPDAVVWVNEEEEQVQPAHGEVEFPEVDLPFEGNNTITIYSKDRAGNVATMEIVVFRQPKKEDGGQDSGGFPVWLVVLVIAIVVVVALVVQRYMLKGPGRA